MLQPIHPAPSYHAFILRMWVEADDPAQTSAASPWRFSLEPIVAGDDLRLERRGFASAEELLAYLQTEMRSGL
ncbi:MAG TPA: hypothetical protein GYA08_08280 [Chloroflexi bacterium]|nr:hypothetical protein [Chloroflexota bacterium]